VVSILWPKWGGDCWRERNRRGPSSLDFMGEANNGVGGLLEERGERERQIRC